MKETIDLLRQLIIFYYTEKDVSKVLSLLSQDIKCFDISSERNVDGIENVEALLNEDFYQSTMSYSVDIYQEETILDGADRGIAAICFVIHTETAEVKCRIMGVSKLENNEIKLSVLNTTLLHHEEKRDLIQVILQENELRSRIQLLDDTTAGGMMGGYLEPGFPFYFINKRMLTYLGYDSEQEFVDDIQGMIDNCMHPDNRAEVGREVERQIIESGEYQVEYRMRKKDGSYIWVHDIGRKMTVSGGREAITSVCYDITREKEHIQLLDSLVDNANGGVALYKVEEDWRMTPLYASAGVGALADLDEAEYMELCQDDAMKSIYEEDRAGVMSAIREAVLNNKVTTLTYRVPDKNGGYIWINGMFSKSGEQDGRPVMRAVYTPSTMQYDLQFTALSTDMVGIYVADADTDELYYANDACFQLHGVERCQIAGKTCHEVFFGSEDKCGNCWKNDTNSDSGHLVNAETKDGKVLSVTMQRRRWNHKNVLVVLSTDVTEKHQLQKQLTDVVNHVPAGVCLYRWDGKRMDPIVISDYYSNLLGIDGKKKMQEASGINYDFVHPDDLPGLQEFILQNVKGSKKNLVYKYRIWNARKNAYVFFLVSANTVKQTDGSILIYMSSADITNEMKLQESLQETKTAVGIAIKNGELGLWSYDLDTKQLVQQYAEQGSYGYGITADNIPER